MIHGLNDRAVRRAESAVESEGAVSTRRADGEVARVEIDEATARSAAAWVLRHLAAGLTNGGMVLVRNIGTDEAIVDTEIADQFIAYAQLIDGKTLEQAAAEME